jgi:hypothetical protein
MNVDLTEQEWQVVLGMIATQPWRDANPLLIKIGGQLRPKETSPFGPPTGNGKEVIDERDASQGSASPSR